MAKELIRTWESGPFKLKLYDLFQRDSLGKSVLAYEFFHDGKKIFSGSDFSASPLDSVDSDETVFGLLGFLSLGEHDVDEDYFQTYTRDQIAWRDAHAEDLASLVFDFEENLENEENESGSQSGEASGSEP